MTTQTLMLTGACFWCIEAVWQTVPGIEKTTPGYVWMTHGDEPQESQERWPVERIEAVSMQWNEDLLPLDRLMDIYLATTFVELVDWSVAGDFSKVRAGLFFEQVNHAQKARERLDLERSQGRVVHAHVFALADFTVAGEWDHDFYRKRPSDDFSRNIIEPKLRKLAGVLHDQSSDPDGKLT